MARIEFSIALIHHEPPRSGQVTTSQFSITNDRSDLNGPFSIILLLNNGQIGSHTFFTIIIVTYV